MKKPAKPIYHVAVSRCCGAALSKYETVCMSKDKKRSAVDYLVCDRCKRPCHIKRVRIPLVTSVFTPPK